MSNLILTSLISSGATQHALLILVAILGVLVISSIIFTIIFIRTQTFNRGNVFIAVLLYLVTLFVGACVLISFLQYKQSAAPAETVPETTVATAEETTVEPTVDETTVPPTEPDPTVDPMYTEKSDPANWKIDWSVLQDGSVVENYQRPNPIQFGYDYEYTPLEGIVTFRGNNYRNGATYGNANVVNKTLTKKWSKNISSLNEWTGCGWTGQPLIVRWDDETKAIMGLYEEKKTKTGLVEVIYATLDGHIYFYDLDDGSYTRDPIYVGVTFKGAGSLDPRGYPLMYVGTGVSTDSNLNMYVVSLVENKVIYKHSGIDSDTNRWWFAFDSSPLVAAEADTLIWPGESGILYTIRLNTQYDKTAGTLTVSPDHVVKTRYQTSTGRKLGYESSAIVVDQYLYVADNGGMMVCIDLQTMTLRWAQDIKDDVNATPVFEWGDDGKGYLYVGTSMEYGQGTSYIYKLDANNGEILWEHQYGNIPYNKEVSGGVLSSPLLGKKGTQLEGLIIFPIAKTASGNGGTIAALNTKTGETVWEITNKYYHWSSPVAVYGNDGNAYFVLCDSAGIATMYNASGEVVTTISLGSNVEASPVIFENTMVVGTRGKAVYGIDIG